MTRTIRLAAGLAILACAACTQGAPVEPGSVTADYSIGGGDWSSGGGITIAARTFERNGATVVCGAWATDRQGGVSVDLNEIIVEAASVYGGGTRLVQNLGFMNRIPYAQNITGARANCVAAGKPWQASFAETRIVVPRQSFMLDEETGLNIRFRPGPRPDIAL